MNYTTTAVVDENECVRCGNCVQNCSAEAIELVDTFEVVNDNRCIGCGVCAYLCPENAMKLRRTGPRNVFAPPPKLSTN